MTDLFELAGPIQCVAERGLAMSPEASRAVAGLGRTEDLAWSPGGRRIAVCSFDRNVVIVLNVEVDRGSGELRLTHPLELESPSFAHPHGAAFLDDARLAVASRGGSVVIVAVPPHGASSGSARVLADLGAGTVQFRSPGSVRVIDTCLGFVEVFVCDNLLDEVTRFTLDEADLAVVDAEILVRRGLALPDGIALSTDGFWLAVSSHDGHEVLIYRNDGRLSPGVAPSARLRGMRHPHGLCFTVAGDLIVADASAPVLHIFDRRPSWDGVHTASRLVQVMSNKVFERGRKNPQEGGPKGILSLDADGVLAITSEEQAFAVFALGDLVRDHRPPAPPAVLSAGSSGRVFVRRLADQLSAARADRGRAESDARADRSCFEERGQALVERHGRERKALEEDLARCREALATEQSRLNAVLGSRAWALTAPFRSAADTLKRLTRR